MTHKYLLRALLLVLIPFMLTTCTKDGKINIFSLDDDIKLGQQVRDEIAGDLSQYPVLDRSQYAASYAYLEQIRDNILNGGNVDNKDKFEWQVHIIQDDKTLNAFVTPGGYIYVYTGLIKFLQNEDQLAQCALAPAVQAAQRKNARRETAFKADVDILEDTEIGNLYAL